MSSALLTLAGSGGSGGGLTGLQFNEYADATSATVSVNIGDYQSDRVIIILASVSNDSGGSGDYPNVLNMDGGTTEVSATAFTTTGGVSGPIFAVSDRGAFSGKTSINLNVEMISSANVTRFIVACYTYYGGTATPDITQILENETNSANSARSVTLSTPTPDFVFSLGRGGKSDLAFTAPSGATQQSTYTVDTDSFARAQHIEDPLASDLTQTIAQDFNFPRLFMLLYAAKFNLK